MKKSRLGLAAAVVLALGLLSGCAAFIPLVNTVAEKVNGSLITPAVGDCWHTDFTTIDSESTWSNGRPVACATTHQSYTYAVPTLSRTLARTLVDEKTGKVRGDIDTAAWSSCDAAWAHFLPSATRQESRVDRGYFLPSDGMWHAGARWVRCDFSIIAYGSSFADPRLEKLPTKINDFVRHAESTPEIFALCVNTKESTQGSDPLNSDTATYADCAKDPQWREASEDKLTGDDTAPFPSEKERNEFDQAHCGDPADAAGKIWITYEPTTETWKTGDRIVEC